MILGQAGFDQGLPLARAGGGKDLGAELAGEPDRGHADPAGAGMDQHPLAGLQGGQVKEPVAGGEKDGRHRGRLLKGPAGGDRR